MSTPTRVKIMVLGVEHIMEKKDINIEIGRRIKNARETAGLTQDRFAELIDMGPKNLSSVERGQVGISIATLQRICRVLSISSDQILFESKTDNNPSELAERLSRLTPQQYQIANDFQINLLKVLL